MATDFVSLDDAQEHAFHLTPAIVGVRHESCQGSPEPRHATTSSYWRELRRDVHRGFIRVCLWLSHAHSAVAVHHEGILFDVEATHQSGQDRHRERCEHRRICIRGYSRCSYTCRRRATATDVSIVGIPHRDIPAAHRLQPRRIQLLRRAGAPLRIGPQLDVSTARRSLSDATQQLRG
jgi:hypothetical protein